MRKSLSNATDLRAELEALRERVRELDLAESALRESEERFRLLAENVPGTIYVCRNDDRRTMMFVNDAVEPLTGYAKDDFLEDRIHLPDLYHPEDSERVLHEVAQAVEVRRPFHMTYRIRHRSGEWRWAEEHGTAVFRGEDHSGSVLLKGFISDITDRKRADEGLRHRVAFEQLITTLSTHFINLKLSEIDDGIHSALRRIGEFAGVDRSYIFLYSDDGSCMSNTHEWCAPGIELQRERLQDCPVTTFPWFTDQMRGFQIVHVPRVSDMGPERAAEKTEWEAQLIQSLICVPMVSANRLLGFVGFDSVRVENTWANDDIALLRIAGEMLANVLERQRAEASLREAQQRLSTVVTGAPIILFALDRDGVFTLSKGEALRLMGLDPDAVVGQSAFDLYKDHPAIKESVRRALTGESFATIAEVQGLMFEVRYQPIVGEDGCIEGTIGVALDITERSQLQKQLLQSQKLESIGTLAGGIAHDYNNLLAVIIGNASMLLRDDSLSDRTRRGLTDMMTAAERGSALSHQLLAYARGGRQRPVPTDLNRLVRSVLDILRRTTPPQIDFMLTLSPGASLILADPTQVEQVIMNLCLNAIQASRSPSSIDLTTGNITLDGREADKYELSPGRYVRLEVKDHGCGMDGATMERIFEPFFTTKPEGRGMGLSATLGIVESHGGRIRITSTPGKGTSVAAWLPAAPEDATEILPDRSPGAVRLARGTETIVLVDDEPDVARTLESLLSSLGYVVIGHTDADQAMAFLERHSEDIDLVLTDMNMRRHSGEAVFEHARQHCPHAAVLLTSGFDDPALTESILARGAAGFISKPFTLATLAQTVRQALDDRNASHA